MAVTPSSPYVTLNLLKFQEFPKRFERSKAIERLERLERTDPRDKRSEAIEPFDRTQGRRVERLEQAQAKIVLRFMKDSRATISSVDHRINKSSLLPARDSWHGRGLGTQPPAIATGKSSLSPFIPPQSPDPFSLQLIRNPVSSKLWTLSGNAHALPSSVAVTGYECSIASAR